MDHHIENVSGRWFVDGIWGILSSNCYFSCADPKCPFSLKVSTVKADGAKKIVGVERTVFEYHYHEDDGKSRTQAKREIKRTISQVSKLPYSQSVDFSDLLDLWLQRALTMSSSERKRLRDIEKVKVYAMRHLEGGATQIKRDSGVTGSSRSICNMRNSAKKEVGIPTSIREILEVGNHHLLCNDGDDILVLGMSTSLAIMSSSPMIHGDGTFTCTIQPFSQLYILHAVVANDTSYPMLYCLLKGKTQSIYKRLLGLIEVTANERHMSVFNRQVRFMVDFEKAFINAIQDYEAGDVIVCCLFHFTKNVRKRANQSIEEIKKRFGKTSIEAQTSEWIKRMFMMLPFLPDSLILPETVDAILGFWEGEFPGTVGVFDGFKDFMLKVYVGQTASYKPRMWSASGMRIRTNNAAESLNGRVNRTLRRDGKITCDQFLVAIETQMAIASREIDDGCKSRTKSVSERRNDLLAAELDDFLNGKIGLFAFLEHCSTILTIKTKRRGDAFVSQRAKEQQMDHDKVWVDKHRRELLEPRFHSTQN